MTYPGKVITALVIAAGFIALWQLRTVALLLFGGLLFAIVFSALTQWLQAATRLSRRASFGLTLVLLAAGTAALLWWIGGELSGQLRDLRQQLPAALESVRRWLSGTALGSHAVEAIDEIRQQDVPWARIAGAATLTATALGNFVLMVLLGVFVAMEPGVYREGFVRLLPVRHRARLSAALDDAGKALAGWLKGQALSMLFVGLATWIGLALLGVPLALILGVLAGVLDFVPFFGPIVSGLLAVLLAFVQGPDTALYVALLALAIQQLEGNLLMPLLQRWAVKLPPALGVLSVVVAGTLFGLPGILFATPLVVVAMVLVRRLYVEGTLESDPARV